MHRLPTITHRDRFGDTWETYAGADARRIRAEVKAERAAALDRYDADPSQANYRAFAALADVEQVVGERLHALNARAAA